MTDLPIGVFDSGVGGLTVLKSLAERWPYENFVYLADTARLPYGAKSPETIESYIVQNLKYLLGRGVKAVVVACNTASSVLLKTRIPAPVPVINVITPGARVAAQTTKNGRIGVMGTRATVLSEAYVQAIHAIDAKFEVHQQPCPLLVPLIEENWIDDPLTNMVLYRYLQTLLRHQIDTLVMGCTHYPVLRAAIQKVVGNSIELVDSSLGVIDELTAAHVPFTENRHREIHVVCTDLTAHMEKLTVQLLEPVVTNSITWVQL